MERITRKPKEGATSYDPGVQPQFAETRFGKPLDDGGFGMTRQDRTTNDTTNPFLTALVIS